MTWLIPSALGIAGATAIVAFALHLIARTRPLAEPFPTARFVPQRSVHARTRSVALSDLLLLLARVAAIMAVGAAVAGPVPNQRGRVARIVLIDRSRAVADEGEARDSVRRFANANDVIIPFDSIAWRQVKLGALDSVSTSVARGSVSTALAAASRAAATASIDADSIELVLVSPVSREEMDEATLHLRSTWPGRVRVVPIRETPVARWTARVDSRGSGGDRDAVVAGFSLMGAIGSPATVRLVRDRATSDDTSWARTGGHVLLHWPAAETGADWPKRATIDAIGGVASGGAVLVGRFPRLWVLDGAAVARWSDGEPAVVEHATAGRPGLAGGCIRDVGILIDQSSDLTLRAPFRRFASALLSPCGGVHETGPIDAVAGSTLAGGGSLAPAAALRDRATESSPVAPGLLAFAALLLIGELAFRRSLIGRRAT